MFLKEGYPKLSNSFLLVHKETLRVEAQWIIQVVNRLELGLVIL